MIHIRLTGAFMIRVDSWRLFLYTVSLFTLCSCVTFDASNVASLSSSDPCRCLEVIPHLT